MRKRVTAFTAALLLASATAMAQQPAAPSGDESPSPMGTIDFGYRGTSTTGDAARYQRYRDLRSGLHTDISIGKDNEKGMWGFKAWNIGYKDQSYSFDTNMGKVSFSAFFDAIPLNYSYMSKTPWVESSPGVLTLDSATRLFYQNNRANTGIVGIPQNCAQARTTPCILPAIPATASYLFEDLAKPFDLISRRDTFGFNMRFDASEQVAVDFAFKSTNKTGQMPFGASFAFNVANEVPLTLDNRTNDVEAGLEYLRPEGMLRVSYAGSWFTNNVKELIWDNPYRATDTNPFDASGYSNGNGPARGRMSLPPSNNMMAVSFTGLYKMPNHTTLNGNVTMTQQKQDETLIPWTINPVIANSTIYKSFPGLAALPRNTAQAEVKGINALFNFSTRPSDFFYVNMRYRYNDHKNSTPAFDAVEYVRFDAVPEETGGETEQFNVKQNTLDITGTFNIAPHTAWRVGYSLDDYKRSGRAFSDMTDYVARTSLDIVGSPMVTVRALYEYTERIGTGFSEAAIEDGGAQGGLRFYDEADRRRKKASLIFILSPMDNADINASVAYGKDSYGGEGHQFGLLSNDYTAYNIGITLSPMPNVLIGANYGYDKYGSFQKSRNANPPANPAAGVAASDYGSWFDTNRDWTMTNDEKVNNANIFFDINKIGGKADLRFSYDYEDSNNSFLHGGPRITEFQTNKALSGASAIVYPGFTIAAPCAAGYSSCFLPLPDVTNKWQKFAVDLKYMFTKKAGIALGYWYEKLDISDFATIDTNGPVGFYPATGTPKISYLGEISTGYGNRPYTGQTGFVRLLFAF